MLISFYIPLKKFERNFELFFSFSLDFLFVCVCTCTPIKTSLFVMSVSF